MQKIQLKQISNDFIWKQFEPHIILWAVRWYIRYPISYRNLQEMIEERGLNISLTTPYRWIQEYAPLLDKKIRSHLKQTNASWRTDETYIKIKGQWKYLYRAVDSSGNTLDWLLSENRNQKAAKKFFKKVLKNSHCKAPVSITVDKNAAYPLAIDALKAEHRLAKNCKLRQVKFLNNIQEQDHRFIKRLIKNNQWFQSFKTAENTLAGYEAMHRIRKRQIRYVAKNEAFVFWEFSQHNHRAPFSGSS